MSKNIIVSDLFVEIYEGFNVVSQIDKMKQLSKKELYLLLTLCLDRHSDDDPVVKHNIMEFKDNIMEIYDIQDDKVSENEFILELIKETDDKYIDTDNILDKNNNKLSEPLSKEDVRNAKINIINK